jgi:hypothetical protein
MTGDRRVRFLGEGAVATLPPYPEMPSGSLTCCVMASSARASSHQLPSVRYGN